MFVVFVLKPAFDRAEANVYRYSWHPAWTVSLHKSLLQRGDRSSVPCPSASIYADVHRFSRLEIQIFTLLFTSDIFHQVWWPKINSIALHKLTWSVVVYSGCFLPTCRNLALVMITDCRSFQSHLALYSVFLWAMARLV